MSYEIGRAALNLQWTPRVARTEYVDNWEVVRHFTGKDPRQDGTAWERVLRGHPPGLPVEHERRAAGGGVSAGASPTWAMPSTWRTARTSGPSAPRPSRRRRRCCPSTRWRSTGWHRLRRAGRATTRPRTARRRTGCDQVVTGGYYNTLDLRRDRRPSAGTCCWRRRGLTRSASASSVLGSIFEQTSTTCEAWAATSIEFFMCHDDMVWTQGPFMQPDFYRTYIFPRYRELWAIAAGGGEEGAVHLGRHLRHVPRRPGRGRGGRVLLRADERPGGDGAAVREDARR